MMRSMFAAISGLKNHQTMMDVVGNNIANVSTTGFKQSRVSFQDILSQTVRGASGPQGGLAGVNAEQVGLGVVLGGIDTIQTQGTLESTGKSTDMAIQGDGYFMMSDGKSTSYSRDGSFDLGTDGTIVNPASGLHVMGWQANPITGLIDTTAPPTNITVPVGAGMIGKASTTLSVSGNLDSGTLFGAAIVAPAVAVPVTLGATVYDTQGNALPVTLTATKTAADTWTVTATGPGTVAVIPATIPPSFTPIPYTTVGGPLVFDTSGKVASGGSLTITIPGPPTAVATFPVVTDLSQLTQLSAPSSLNPATTDGASAGSLTSFNVGQAGDITGVYSNGYKQPLGQMALASFANPGGLINAGGNLFQSSANSGNPNIGTPTTGSRGSIATGFLEGSNVDLAQQFTDMIMAERGFQANSKVITTSDEILQTLVDLKH